MVDLRGCPCAICKLKDVDIDRAPCLECGLDLSGWPLFEADDSMEA